MLWKSSFPQILLGCSFDLELGKALLELEKTLAISRLPLRRLVAITNGAVASRAAQFFYRNPALPSPTRVCGGVHRSLGGPSIKTKKLDLIKNHTPFKGVSEKISLWRAPVFPLKGQDVLELIPPGPRVGQLLKQVETWWIAQGFQLSRSACLKLLRKWAQQPR